MDRKLMQGPQRCQIGRGVANDNEFVMFFRMTDGGMRIR